jgi:3-hydroxybutyrate dehydrogenase
MTPMQDMFPSTGDGATRLRYLAGRVAWVTGGATGMGRAIATALAAEGAHVAIGSLVDSESSPVLAGQNVYRPSMSEMEAARLAIAAHGGKTFARPLDVCDSVSVESFHAAAVAELGDIDILINAAGSSTRAYMVGHPDVLWQRMLDTNLTGPYRTIKLCLGGMIERRWGRIINVASTAASLGAVAHAAYCASKSGLLGLTRCVALEGAPHGVTCNSISPGWTDTPLNRSGVRQQMVLEGVTESEEEYRARIAQSIPQRRFMQPAEIGALAAYLCRDDALGMTMQDLTLAGGSIW